MAPDEPTRPPRALDTVGFYRVPIAAKTKRRATWAEVYQQEGVDEEALHDLAQGRTPAADALRALTDRADLDLDLDDFTITRDTGETP